MNHIIAGEEALRNVPAPAAIDLQSRSPHSKLAHRNVGAGVQAQCPQRVISHWPKAVDRPKIPIAVRAELTHRRADAVVLVGRILVPIVP